MRLDFRALCGEKELAALEHHHFIPKVHGGTDDETNMFCLRHLSWKDLRRPETFAVKGASFALPWKL